jgi:purine-binding chemotaxis protein CheW
VTAPATTDAGVVGGLVTFRLGEREYATPLAEVREVVRLQGLAELPGMRVPLAGVLDLRGSALPVLDLRPGRREDRGDVLVVEHAGLVADGAEEAGGAVGVAVDEVRAVLPDGVLHPAGGADRAVLPEYVVDVLRGEQGVVFLVDLQRMVDSARAAAEALPPLPAQT